ncbi:vacuolar protein sorting protein VPS11, partial [Protomyces lactucae-debilis]
WRQFNFFECVKIPDAEDASAPGPVALSPASSGAVIASTDSYIFLGTQDGQLQAINRSFKVAASIQAYAHGRLHHIMPCDEDLLVTLGDEPTSSGADGPTLKTWSLSMSKKGVLQFKLLSAVPLHSQRPHPITCCTTLPDLSQVAIGSADGRVVLVKGDLVRDRGAKQRTVYESEEPITGLQFLVSNKITTLYIFTTSKLLTLTTISASGKSVTQVPRIMESVGAALGCIAYDKHKNQIAVVRQDALYLYTVDGRGPCYALEGSKSAIHIFKDYTIILQPPSETRASAMKSLGRIGNTDAIDDATKLTMLQTDHKFISHTSLFPQGLRTVLTCWHELFLITLDGRLFQLTEISMQSKLDILQGKSMYTLAIQIAQEAQYDEAAVDAILIKYGDYLYSRDDFEAAVKQYIKAIKRCDVSAVMRKFLEAQHVPLLTEFLEALHRAKLSNADYSTLLLNCYAKLKQKEKLQDFVREQGGHAIDLDVAVALCRQAGYYDQAISLTAQHKNHVMCIGIMTEDKQDFASALAYMRKLKKPEDLGLLLTHFGRILMAHLPAETTRLFVEFYTGSYMPETEVQAAGIISPPRRVTGGYTAVIPVPVKSGDAQSSAASILTTEEEAAQYLAPPPRSAFPIFVDYPEHFRHFLEVLLERQTHTEEDLKTRADLVSTLLEIYLQLANKSEDVDAQSKWQEKAKALLDRESNVVDSSNALLLFHLASYKEGAMLVQERSGRKEDVFRSYCTARDTPGVLRTLKSYGQDTPQLYPLALKYLTSAPQIVEEAGPALGLVLNQIKERRLLVPIQVVQALSANAVATMGIIKTYLADIIERERREIEANTKLIASYKQETLEKETEALKLAESAIQLQMARCSRCGGTFDFPVIHFLCKHSFHQRCVLDNAAVSQIGPNATEPACPICHDADTAVQAMADTRRQASTEKHELFLEGLEGARDRAAYTFARLDFES